MTTALVIVAHPDDETIWMGGTILTHKDWNWTIISLCRKNDPDRMPKFKKVCSYYRATAVIGDLDDEHLQPLSTEEVIAKIKSLLIKRSYDYIYTHGSNGEYGHIRHKEVHIAVSSLLQSNELQCNKVFYFSYKPSDISVPSNSELKLALPDENALYKIDFNNAIAQKKSDVVIELYGFTPESFEALSCNKTEAFYSI